MTPIDCLAELHRGQPDLPLHGIDATRQIEHALQVGMEPHALMRRAGLSVARLALALAPDAERIWIACGPGNNGGDGFEAAALLQQAGKRVQVTALGTSASRPTDAAIALQRAQDAGVHIEAQLDEAGVAGAGLAIDALLGLGGRTRPAGEPQGELTRTLRAFNAQPMPRLSIDLPSGLDAERGTLAAVAAQASDTLSLLTLKPGLFTAQGRDHAGRVWFDDLGAAAAGIALPAAAWLGGSEAAVRLRAAPRQHAQHKGSFGDVLVVGGAPGMAGAALLAARAALRAGAGRVVACLLDGAAPTHDLNWPELMLRHDHWRTPAVLATATVVCGCGGGAAVAATLPQLLSASARLVLDADALNAVAADSSLQTLLRARDGRGLHTVLTPHPLEAARLAGLPDAGAIQAHRLEQAQALAESYRCVVLLKGSGSVLAAPGLAPCINGSGNARLASAGTGDVLAGWLGGLWSACGTDGSVRGLQQLAQAACWLHGRAAEPTAPLHGCVAAEGPSLAPLRASELIEQLGR